MDIYAELRKCICGGTRCKSLLCFLEVIIEVFRTFVIKDVKLMSIAF